MGGGAPLNDGIGEFVGDGADDPSPHDAVHANPIQGVAADGEEECLAPVGVEGRGDVKDEACRLRSTPAL